MNSSSEPWRGTCGVAKKARHSQNDFRGISGLGDYQLSSQLRLSCRHGSGNSDSGCGFGRRRGVQKTSIHLFRHTFARKYLIDCGGDAFTLQKLLGHSTLAMTKHYCAIYDADLTKNYDNFSPLAQMKAGSAKIKMSDKRR